MPLDHTRAEEALLRVEQLLERLVGAGLERVSPSSVAELRELARTVHHARLVRLERDLAGLATAAERYLGRDPSFSFRSWVGACARAHLLTVAARRVLADPTSADADEVLGVPRRTYEPVPGRLRVHALGASGWVSDSGFCGITVHLWDPAGARPLQATVARPTTLVGTDPRRMLFHPVSEISMLTVQELSHGSWVLDDVRLSSDGRVSLHTGLQAEPAPPVGVRAYAPFACSGAAEVLDRLAARELDPLGGGTALVFVEIAKVRDVGLDDTAARGSAELVDRSGAVLRVSVPLRAEHDLLLDNLARLQQAPPAGVFGRAWMAGGVVGIEPYTAVFDAPVKLAIRRGVEVQEVHLGIEPLPGQVTVPAAKRTPRPTPPGTTRELERAADAVDQVVERLFGTGLAVAEPGLVAELGRLAEVWGAAGVEGAAGLLRALGSALSSGEPSAAHRALYALVTWLRLFRAGVALHTARASVTPSEAAPAARRGDDLVVLPIGAELRGPRLVVHALAAADRGYVVLEDELPGVDPLDPLARPVPSRLFQAEVALGEVLSRPIVLEDHPIALAPGRRVVRPAFHSAARLAEEAGEATARDLLPLVDQVPRAGPFRIRARATRDPSGWSLHLPGVEPLAVEDLLLQLDLEKRSADDEAPELELCAVVRRDVPVVLAVDGRWPTLDPRATRWSVGRLRDRATDPRTLLLIDALAGGPLPPPPEIRRPRSDRPPDGEQPPEQPSREDVEVQVVAVREAVRRGGVLPPAAELVGLGVAWARVHGLNDPPIRALGLPRERLWLAAVAPLAGWLRGARPDDDRVRDALLLAAAAGEADVLVSDRPLAG